MGRGFERCCYTCKFPDLSSTGFGVQSFNVTLLANPKGSVDKNFQKIILPDYAAGHFTDFIRRTDETVDGDDPAVKEKPGYLSYPADVLKPVSRRKTKVVVDPGPDVVTVKDLCQVPALE